MPETMSLDFEYVSEFKWTINSFLVHMVDLDYDGSYNFPPKET